MAKSHVLAGALTLIITAGALVAQEAAPAATPTTAPAPVAPDAFTPAVRKALTDLTSENFKIREAALANLELALGEQMRALVASSEDPEVQSRLVALVQFNEGLSQWVLDTLKLPPAQRKSQLDFGLKPEVLPIIAQVFASDPDKRVKGVRLLAKIDGTEATDVLARLLNDPDRMVYVAAMEAVWDRKPTDSEVDALWTRAVDSGFAVYRPQPVEVTNERNLTFRGRLIGTGGYVNRSYIQGQDAGIAGEVLANINAPQVSAKLNAIMGTFETLSKSNPFLSMNSEQMKNVFRLVEVYKPKEAIKIMYHIATGAQNFGVQRMQINADTYAWTNRTMPLATVIVATGQKAEDYHLKHLAQQMGGMWVVSTEEDENNAIKKLQEWMAVNGEPYGLKEEAQATATRPSTPAEVKPADVNPPIRKSLPMKMKPPVMVDPTVQQD